MNALLALLISAGILIAPSHFDHVNSVTFYNEERIFNNHGKEINAPELTDRKKGEIFIYKNATPRNIVHGIGHVICEIKGHPKPFGQEPYITPYAATDKLEDCAETFEAYYMKECYLNTFRIFKPVLYQKCLLIRKWDRLAR